VQVRVRCVTSGSPVVVQVLCECLVLEGQWWAGRGGMLVCCRLLLLCCYCLGSEDVDSEGLGRRVNERGAVNDKTAGSGVSLVVGKRCGAESV